MRNLFVFFALSILIFGCQQKPATPQNLDLEGFTIQDIPGSDMKRATMKDVKGKLVEEGTIRNGRKNGMWVTYHKERDVPVTIGNYVDGVPNGPMFKFTEYGYLEEMSGFLNNRLDGRFAKIKNVRKSEEGNYVNGLLDGNYKKYYDGTDKVQQEMNYKNNKLDGDMIYYSEQGIATMKYIYKNGEKVSGGMVEGGK